MPRLSHDPSGRGEGASSLASIELARHFEQEAASQVRLLLDGIEAALARSTEKRRRRRR